MAEREAAAERAAHVDDRTDRQLVERVRSGDEAAFGELVTRHLSRAYAVAYRLLSHREDAEDAVQDAFATLLTRLDTYDATRPFAPWFYRMVANRCGNLRDAREVRRTEALAEELVAAPRRDAAEQAQLRDRLAAALAALPERQRAIVQLFEVDGFSGAEIAELLDMPAGTVRWNLHEARRALRERLVEFTEEEEQ